MLSWCSDQLAARSASRSWPRLLATDTALGLFRMQLRSVVAVSFSSRRARRARAPPRGEPADRPQSTCLCALRAWRGCLRGQLASPHAVGRGSSPPTPRSVGGCGFGASLPSRSRPVARVARALRHVENQPTAHIVLDSARCVLGAVVCEANSRHLTQLAEAHRHRHRARSAAPSLHFY